MVISLVSEYNHHPSVRHLSTRQGISLGQKLHTYPVQKTFAGASCSYFLGQKRTPIVLFLLKTIACSAACRSHHKDAEDVPVHYFWGWSHTYHQQTLDDSQRHFPQCIPHRLNSAGLRVHPGEQQINMNFLLPYTIGYSKGGWKVGALIHPNVSNFTQNLKFFKWTKFDEGCWNYQTIPVHLKAVSILPSEAKKNGKIVSGVLLPLIAK